MFYHQDIHVLLNLFNFVYSTLSYFCGIWVYYIVYVFVVFWYNAMFLWYTGIIIIACRYIIIDFHVSQTPLLYRSLL